MLHNGENQMVLFYVSCADDYILNVCQSLILVAPEVEAFVVLGGLWLRSTVPNADVLAAEAVVSLYSHFILLGRQVLVAPHAMLPTAITFSVCTFISVISGDMYFFFILLACILF